MGEEPSVGLGGGACRAKGRNLLQGEGQGKGRSRGHHRRQLDHQAD